MFTKCNYAAYDVALSLLFTFGVNFFILQVVYVYK